jgi:hypothetical protein
MELTTVEDYIEAKLTHSIHTSGRRSFRGCRRRWNWIFNQFYYPTVTAKPLEFGVAAHKAWEAMYDPDQWYDRAASAAVALVVFKKTVEAQRAAYRDKHGELSLEEEQDYDERVELGLGMIKYYGKKFLPYEQLTPIKVEVAFEVPIKHSDGRELWCKCDNCWNRYMAFWKARIESDPEQSYVPLAISHHAWKGLPVTYGGRIDVLFVDEYGRIWIGDWKTAAQLTADGKDQFLLLDDQITSYCWALWTLNLDIAGFLYMEIKKGFPQEPEPLKRPYRGCIYSTSKNNDYDYETYVKTVEENDPFGYVNGNYNSYIEWLRTEGVVYHRRHQIDRSEAELQLAGDNIFEEAADMVDPNLRIYPSPGRFSCSFCAFIDPCLAANRGDQVLPLLEVMYEKRKYHYWETKEPSTEGKGGE